MPLIKFRIKEILNKEKFSYKYFEGLFFSKEKTGTEWELAFEGDNGNKYLIRMHDGRKLDRFYVGREVYGIEKPNPVTMRTEKFDRKDFRGLDFHTWTKEKFEEVLEEHIQRTKESIEAETEELARLEKLKATPQEVAQ